MNAMYDNFIDDQYEAEKAEFDLKAIQQNILDMGRANVELSKKLSNLHQNDN